jgi:flagellar biogenesis protein FliO
VCGRVSAYVGYLIETFVTLAGVCVLAAVILWAARRAGVARSTGPIELRGYLPLDARRAIALVKVGATVFVVGVGDGGFTKLGEVPDDALPATQPRRGPTFAHVLARVLGDRRAGDRTDEA